MTNESAENVVFSFDIAFPLCCHSQRKYNWKMKVHGHEHVNGGIPIYQLNHQTVCILHFPSSAEYTHIHSVTQILFISIRRAFIATNMFMQINLF